MILVAGVVLAVAACGSGISQEEHDAVFAERDSLNQQASDLQGQLTTITTERDGLNQQASDLQSQLTTT
jgi:cell division protein FtsB